jgi:hypothetical protein
VRARTHARARAYVPQSARTRVVFDSTTASARVHACVRLCMWCVESQVSVCVRAHVCVALVLLLPTTTTTIHTHTCICCSSHASKISWNAAEIGDQQSQSFVECNSIWRSDSRRPQCERAVCDRVIHLLRVIHRSAPYVPCELWISRDGKLPADLDS